MKGVYFSIGLERKRDKTYTMHDGEISIILKTIICEMSLLYCQQKEMKGVYFSIGLERKRDKTYTMMALVDVVEMKM